MVKLDITVNGLLSLSPQWINAVYINSVRKIKVTWSRCTDMDTMRDIQTSHKGSSHSGGEGRRGSIVNVNDNVTSREHR